MCAAVSALGMDISLCGSAQARCDEISVLTRQLAEGVLS
jgi:hypothetical protein